jgi:hypothetical protein
LNGASAFSRQVLFDNDLWYSQDAITPTASGLGFAEVNDSRQLREPSDNSIFAALQDSGDTLGLRLNVGTPHILNAGSFRRAFIVAA